MHTSYSSSSARRMNNVPVVDSPLWMNSHKNCIRDLITHEISGIASLQVPCQLRCCIKLRMQNLQKIVRARVIVHFCNQRLLSVTNQREVKLFWWAHQFQPLSTAVPNPAKALNTYNLMMTEEHLPSFISNRLQERREMDNSLDLYSNVNQVT